MRTMGPLILALLASPVALTIPAPAAAWTQMPSPRACETARRQGVALRGCPRRRSAPPARQTPVQRQATPAPAPAAPDPLATPVEAAPAIAAHTVFGDWTGIVLEPRSQEHPQYRVVVRLERDNGGRPVGMVVYEDFPCAGVWSGATLRGSVWRFDETITDGQDRCARNVVVELEITGDGDFLNVRLYPLGLENSPSRGTLQRVAASAY